MLDAFSEQAANPEPIPKGRRTIGSDDQKGHKRCHKRYRRYHRSIDRFTGELHRRIKSQGKFRNDFERLAGSVSGSVGSFEAKTVSGVLNVPLLHGRHGAATIGALHTAEDQTFLLCVIAGGVDVLLSLSASYARQVLGVSWLNRMDWSWKSEIPDSQGSLQYFRNQGIDIEPLVTQPATGILNARSMMTFANGVELGAFGRNLSDERLFAGLAVGGGPDFVSKFFPGPGRELGLDLTYRF